VHLSSFARNILYGFYGDIDLAVVEVSRIRPDGSVILSSSVGISPEALTKAKKIILEVNPSMPDYTGFHDIALPSVHPRVGWPIPIVNVGDRVGTQYVDIDKSKVVALIESDKPDYPIAFKPTTETERKIAENVIEFLMYCHKTFNWGDRLPPGSPELENVANAIVSELYKSPFKQIRFWDRSVPGRNDAATWKTTISSKAHPQRRSRFLTVGGRSSCGCSTGAAKKWFSGPCGFPTMPNLITRLFVIAMNTPIEVDIYGHVNSTHVDGSRVVNGLGGSGDFFRHAYLSIVHTPSVRRLRDGRTVSCVMPYVRHVDHTRARHQLRSDGTGVCL